MRSKSGKWLDFRHTYSLLFDTSDIGIKRMESVQNNVNCEFEILGHCAPIRMV